MSNADIQVAKEGEVVYYNQDVIIRVDDDYNILEIIVFNKNNIKNETTTIYNRIRR